jgi:hypothetical protein
LFLDNKQLIKASIHDACQLIQGYFSRHKMGMDAKVMGQRELGPVVEALIAQQDQRASGARGPVFTGPALDQRAKVVSA